MKSWTFEQKNLGHGNQKSPILHHPIFHANVVVVKKATQDMLNYVASVHVPNCKKLLGLQTKKCVSAYGKHLPARSANNWGFPMWLWQNIVRNMEFLSPQEVTGKVAKIGIAVV